MVEFSQVHTSVFSLTEATPSDLITNRNTARLIAENMKVKLGDVSELNARQAYKPLVVVGPSGAGKGTLINYLTEKYPEKFGFSVSYTTRPSRTGEQNGVHYNFVTMDKFKAMIANDEFIEHCDVHGKMYGTAKEQITKIQTAKKIPLLDIDVQGALKFEKVFPEANYMAILPTNKVKLEQRLRGRGTDSEEAVIKRLGNALSEIEILTTRKNTFMYRVVNDELKVAQNTFELLICGLYPEELLGKNTNELIASTLLIKEGESGVSKFKIAAAITVVGAIAAAAFFALKKKQ